MKISGRVQISCLEVNGSIKATPLQNSASISRLWPARLCAGPFGWHIYATQFSRLKILLGSPSLCALAHSPAMALFLNSKQHNVIIKCNECDKVIQKSRLECDSDNHYQGILVISSSGLYEMIPSIPETGGCSQPCPTL